MRAIIDVGSNSVRMLLPDGEKPVVTTKLGEGLNKTGFLQSEPMARTEEAILSLAGLAWSRGLEVEAFATEAVRSAKNGREFVSALEAKGVPVRVLSGSEEALAGYYGATRGAGGAIMDVGGASTEIVFGREENVSFSVSLPIGIVRARDMFGEDCDALRSHVFELLKDVKMQENTEEVIAIGGTAICTAAVDSGKAYDKRNTDGRAMSRARLDEILKMLLSRSREERLAVAGLHESRVDTICGGLVIITCVMDHLGAKRIVTSERDNLEGFCDLRDKGII